MTIINDNITMDTANNDTAEINIFGDIEMTQWYEEDVTPTTIQKALKNMGDVKTVELHINSYGGNVDAGNGIVAMLDDYKRKTGCKVEAYIEGMAASMASGIAMVADKIYMASNSLMFLHKPIASGYGNAKDFEKTIEMLNKAEICLINNYMRHWTQGEDKLKEALAESTTYTAEEALTVGLCDEIMEPIEIAASMNGIRVGNCTFNQKIADAIKSKFPDLKLKDEKEVQNLEFDSNLENYGINKEMFDKLNISSDTLTQIANTVSEYIKNDKKTLDKTMICENLNCEDISEQEIIDYVNKAKAPSDTDDKAKAKAAAYDKILDAEREKAVANAIRAEGEHYNEARTRKMLANLDYDDIVAQSESWLSIAKEELNAGKQVSVMPEIDTGFINPQNVIKSK